MATTTTFIPLVGSDHEVLPCARATGCRLHEGLNLPPLDTDLHTLVCG
jgi:hypothetical protein